MDLSAKERQEAYKRIKDAISMAGEGKFSRAEQHLVETAGLGVDSIGHYRDGALAMIRSIVEWEKSND